MIRHVVRAIPGALLVLSALTGIALWVSFGSFDLLFPNRTVLRAAMLPPWWTLAAAMALAFVVLAAIVWITSITGARRRMSIQARSTTWPRATNGCSNRASGRIMSR